EALQFHDQLTHKGIQYADCPVSGLPARAREGKLTLMFGGSQTLFGQVSPLLELLGKNIVYCGEVGSGQLMKAVNNIIYNINIVALCEILPLGVAAGISIDALEQVVTSASSRSFAGDHFIPRMMAREFEGDFPLAGAYKDILNMQKVATEKQALTPLMNAMISSYQNALADGLGDEPKSAIIKIYEKVLGIEFKRNKTE
ncbi:MAG: NAD-binding protein, partial [Deltaproteobacteria bacterium]